MQLNHIPSCSRNSNLLLSLFCFCFSVNRVLSSTSLNGTGQETRHRNATGPRGMAAECTSFASCCDCNKEAFWTLGAPQESSEEDSKEKNNWKERKKNEWIGKWRKERRELPVWSRQSQCKHTAEIKDLIWINVFTQGSLSTYSQSDRPHRLPHELLQNRSVTLITSLPMNSLQRYLT